MSAGTRNFTHLRARRAQLRKRLLAWYDRHKRALPWRDTGDPYRILVSEFMLQQTQVSTVLPHFARFLDRFPTLEDLAAAPEEEVLAAWSGLGYYRRARNLQATARAVHHDHRGAWPKDLPALKALPGVGDYTARALASLVHDLPEAVVDGNVIRVLTRVSGWGRPVTTAESKRALQELADSLLAPRRSGDWNQAMMELGATVCTPKSPDCRACPWSEPCAARREGRPERYPVKQASAPTRRILRALAVYRLRGSYFMVQRESGPQLRGSWEFPGVDLEPNCKPRPHLKKHLQRILAREFEVGAELAGAVHTITDKRIQLRAFAVRPLGKHKPVSGARWVKKADLPGLFVSSMTQKILDQL